jgi:uncharacterized membrane protein
MIIYHTLYDLVYIFDCNIAWFDGPAGIVFERFICISFILISGLCINLSKNIFKRGLTVFSAGVLVTVITLVFMPEERIIFGILTFIGSAMLLTGLMNRLLKRINPYILFAVSLILFITLYNVNDGYLGFYGIIKLFVPSILYNGYIMTFLGFPFGEFFSSDYFSFFPWYFLFLSGYASGRIIKIDEVLKTEGIKKKVLTYKIPLLTFLGQRSLLIYLIHQPIIYFILLLLF